MKYTVLAVDLPGLGDSAPPPEPPTATSIAAILVDGIRRLIEPAERFHVVGFSFGGALSGPVALAAGRQVRSVTVVGTGGLSPVRSPIELERWRHLDEAAARDEVHRRNLARLMFADRQAIDSLAVRIQARNVSRARLKSRPIARTGILAHALPAIPAPVAAIYGALDANVHPFLATREQQLRALRSDIDFRVVAGAGHWVQYERPVEFTATLFDVFGHVERVKR